MDAQSPLVIRQRTRSRAGSGAARRRTTSGANVLRPGLTVRRVIAFDESPKEFQHFYQEVATALGARDVVEEFMVERIVICAWRLRRVYRIESGLLSRARTSWNDGTPTITRDIDLVFLRLTSEEDELAKLTRYENSLERSLQLALSELYRHQRQRRPDAALKPLLLGYGGRDRG